MFPPRPVLATLALAAALGGSACQPPRESAARRAAREGILLAGISAEPKSLDPQLATTPPEQAILTALFEGLAAVHPSDDTAAAPGAAEGWESNPDFTEWTFFLRRHAKWSDGAPVTALDFTFAYHRILHPQFAAPCAGLLGLLDHADEYHRDCRGFLLCGLDRSFPVPWQQLAQVNFGGRPDTDLSLLPPEPVFTILTEMQRRLLVCHRGLDHLGLPELEWLAADPGRRFDWPDEITDEVRREVLHRLISRHGQDLWQEAAVGVSAPDDFTLRLRLREPMPSFPALTRHHAWFPVPRHVVLQFRPMTARLSPWSQLPNLVGNGPFQLKSWRLDDRIEVERNPCYWDAAKVRLNGVRFLVIENPYTATRAFLAGQLHATDQVPPDLVAAVRASTPQFLRQDSSLLDPEVQGWRPFPLGQQSWKTVSFAE